MQNPSPYPTSQRQPSQRLQHAALNIIFSLREGIGIQELARKINLTCEQLKPILEQLISQGKVFETRSERKTTYHAACVTLSPELENKELQETLIHEIKRRSHGETAIKLAQRHKQPLEVIEANLQRAVIEGTLQEKRVGALRIYRAQA